MNRERLEHLITVLERVERERLPFDMGTLGGGEDCETATCAEGWAARDPKFQSAGLHITEDAVGHIVAFDGKTSYSALATFFDIHEDDAEFIFDAHPKIDWRNPQYVIARIREVLAMGDAA
jgi:hypothetical protein